MSKDFVAATKADLRDADVVFVVREASDDDCAEGFGVGTQVQLNYDDGTSVPRFHKLCAPHETRWLTLSQLEVERAPLSADKSGAFKVGDKVRIKADCGAPYHDYRLMVPATVVGIKSNSELPIHICYDDKGRYSSVEAKDLEYVDPPTVTITVSRAEAKAFTECFKKDGYMFAGKGVKGAAVLRTFWRALAEAMESGEVRAAKALLTKAGYTVTAK